MTFDDICQLEEGLSETSVFLRYNSTDMKRIMFVSFSNPLAAKAAGHGGLRQVAVQLMHLYNDSIVKNEQIFNKNS